jgi:dihydroorotate dehydrogenase
VSDLYRLIWPVLGRMDPERAHGLAIRALKTGLVGRRREPDDPLLAGNLWGQRFSNPIGLAAGFDKDAGVIGPILDLGFGFTEVGSITPEPQPGNPRPRLFRLAEDRAVINRMGFNSAGLEVARANLARADLERTDRQVRGIVGVNLGVNKQTTDPASDYRRGVEALGRFADYLVVNVSSPNTPGLRALQDRDRLRSLLHQVREAIAGLPNAKRPPLVLKIAPDLTPEDVRDIAAVAIESGLDGIAVSNTTIARPAGLRSPHREESGGLSGRPLMEPSTRLLAELYRATDGRLPLIGIGGVESGETAYRKIRAGASLVQLYTGLVYGGPGLVARIKRELADMLRRDGFAALAEAIGADHRKA